MSLAAACEAMTRARVLEIRYDDFHRWVEVHAVGRTKEGNLIMRVWQTRGGSTSGEKAGWKLLRLDEVIVLGISNEPSQAPRKGYRKGDKSFAQIISQL